MKRYWLASLFGVGIMCGLSSVVYAVDLEAVLKDNTANSGFSVKDASGNTIARFRGDGNVGIGTAGPTTLLDLKTTTVGEGLALKEIDSSTNAALLSAWSTGSLWNQYTSGVATIHFDSTTGGVNWFNNGNVGIGTTTPSVKLVIEGDSDGYLELSRKGTYARSYMIGPWFDDFGIFDRTANDTPRLIITDAGNVGIGTTTPLAKLHVNGNVYVEKDSPHISLKATSGTQQGWTTWVADSGNFYISTNPVSTVQAVTIEADGSVGIGTLTPGDYKLYVAGAAYSTGGWSGSDVRWKKDITPLENSLNNVLKLQGVHYYWKTDEYPDKGFTKEKQVGLIAQDVEKVIPELVNTSEDGYKSVSYEKLTAVLVEAVKELKAENNKLKSEVNELRTLINKVIESPAMPASHKQSCAGVYDNDGI